MRLRTWAAAAACALIATQAHAATLGSDAPELTGVDWVKGEPISLADGKGETIYVVEFWATWCGPCRASIPHLTELQEQFADDNVVIIGISDEDRETVASFAESQGDAMDYHVASAPERGPHKAYMEAFGQGGIPTAFVVDREGRIVWVGHPIMLDEILPAVVDGSYDMAEAQRRAEVMGDIEAITELAFMGEQDAFHERASEAKEKYADFPEALLELAWLIFNVEGMNEENMALGAELAKTGFDAMEEPTAVAHLVYAVALAEQEETEKAIELMREGIDKVDEGMGRLKGIMQMLLDEWEGGEAPAIQ